MTTTQDPDAIRRQIDATRGRLSEDVDVLADSVRPSSVARRTTQRATTRAARVKDAVMGAGHDATDAGSGAAHDAADTLRDVPGVARRQARGNPMAAGAVALAAGWLVGSLLPASDKERRLASTAAERAQPLVDEVKSVAAASAENLKAPAQEAVQAVKDTAKDGAATVKDEGTAKAQEVKEEVRSDDSGSSPSSSGARDLGAVSSSSGAVPPSSAGPGTF